MAEKKASVIGRIGEIAEKSTVRRDRLHRLSGISTSNFMPVNFMINIVDNALTPALPSIQAKYLRLHRLMLEGRMKERCRE